MPNNGANKTAPCGGNTYVSVNSFDMQDFLEGEDHAHKNLRPLGLLKVVNGAPFRFYIMFRFLV